MVRTIPLDRRFPACALAALLSLIPSTVYAQAIERHLPVTPPATSVPLEVPNALPAEQDDAPIGPVLKKIVLLGLSENAHDTAPDGITVGEIPRLHSAEAQYAIADDLRPYLGLPISRRLIAQIEAAIGKYYRANNYPFVSLSTPKQEIDAGQIQIRVAEFKVGTVSVKGLDQGAGKAVRARVTLQPGDAINSRALQEDLDWINRYPFRQVQAIFTPGTELGATDLVLTAQLTKPWQAYGGYSNDGSPSTGRDRLFLGGSVGDLLGRDSVLSLQGTISPDVLSSDDNPHYQSVALSYVLPAIGHGAIEFNTDLVRTYQVTSPFVGRLEAAEADLAYRFALSDIIPGFGATDARVGAQIKKETRTTLFGGVNVFSASMNVYQGYLGLHGLSEDALLSNEWDVSAYFSPGDLDNPNSGAQAALYSQGRLSSTSYGYVRFNYSQLLSLPYDLGLKTQLLGQFAPDPLPSTEQFGLGGTYLVRSYSLDDGSFDTAVILRNELHAPPLLPSGWGSVDPYIFSDFGYGRDDFAHVEAHVASVGVGATTRLLNYSTVRLDIANQLSDDRAVHAGGWFVLLNFTTSY